MQRYDVFEQADAYERYIGRWSRLLTPNFVRWLAVPPQGSWLDVGAGTGSLTQAVLENGFPASVIGIDPSSAFVAKASESMHDPRASFRVGNAMSLEFAAGTFDAAAAALVLNFVPDPHVATAEMKRVVKRGGRVGACVWDYGGGMSMLRTFWDAAIELDPAASELDDGRRFPITRPDVLRATYLSAGLQQVEVFPFEIQMVFKDFDDLWLPFLGGQGSAGGYVVSLTPEKRDELAAGVRGRLTPEADGSIKLNARAWAVRGTVA